MTSAIAERIWGKYVRVSSAYLNRRRLRLTNRAPLVSFTFDDFPRSALRVGGTILNNYGARGTYFASLGLMGGTAPTGTMFTEDDLSCAITQGHEIGCHTYDHHNAGITAPRLFEDSVTRNEEAFSKLFPDYRLQALAYPISEPRPGIKRRMGKRFVCCRGGGQTYNCNYADLNCLKSFFIERSRDNPKKILSLIDTLHVSPTWLIFSTHDVDRNPTPWGCTPELFENLVRCVAASGIRIVPVIEAWTELSASS